jgi:hypothetical protein
MLLIAADGFVSMPALPTSLQGSAVMVGRTCCAISGHSTTFLPFGLTNYILACLVAAEQALVLLAGAPIERWWEEPAVQSSDMLLQHCCCCCNLWCAS